MTSVTMVNEALLPGSAVFESRRLLAHRPVPHGSNCSACVEQWPCEELRAHVDICRDCGQVWPCRDYSEANQQLRWVRR